MIVFSINKKTYNLRNLYSELTIADAERIASVEIVEEDLRELLITDDILLEDRFYDYIRLFLEILSDAPKEILRRTAGEDLAVLFDGMPKAIVSGIFYRDFHNWRSFGIQEVTYKGQLYTLPESVRIEGEEILCYRENCQTVLYAADMLQALRETEKGGFSKLGLICALLLRPPDEEGYNPKKVSERAELFAELPLDIALECFFFFKQYCSQFAIDSLDSSVEDLLREELGLSGYLQRLRLQLSSLWKRLVNRLSGNWRRSSNTSLREQTKWKRKPLRLKGGSRPPLLFTLFVAPAIFLKELFKKIFRI